MAYIEKFNFVENGLLKVVLEHICRIAGRTTDALGLRRGKSRSPYIHPILPPINDPNQTIFRNQFVQRDREQRPWRS